MRGIPAIKTANALLSEVRKDLSDEKVNELTKLLLELDKVSGEDSVEALFQQGLIFSYLNKHDLASKKFLESHSIDENEVSLTNGINALKLVRKEEVAFEEGFSFLRKNPNNPHLFLCLSRTLLNYYSPKYFSELELYQKYHIENKDLMQAFNAAKISNNIFSDLGLQTKILNQLLFIVVSEVHKIFFKQPCNPTIAFDRAEGCVYYQVVNLPSYEDILILNRNYDVAIQQAIETEEIDFDEYIDSISKLVVGFRANPNQRVA